jgi:hypothetical protein
MFHHVYQINMYILGSIFILTTYETWENVHLTNHVAKTLRGPNGGTTLILTRRARKKDKFKKLLQ